MKKHILGAFVFLGLLVAGAASGATLQGYQGGTGISTSTAANDGKCLTESSSTPFLTWSIGTCGSGGGSATTTINGVTGPTFTFSIVGTTTASSITTSSANLFLNLLYYSSGTDINVGSNGVINFVNTPGYGTSTGANPSAQVGTSAINGSANTFMRSDGSPAINQGAAFSFSALGNTTSTANISASTFNASTSITNQSVKSALVLNNSSGLEGAYGGSVCTNQGVSAISATGTVTCTTFATSTGGSPAGSQTYIQYNDGGTFAATSTFTFTSSTQRLFLNAATSSVFIGNNAAFATSSAVVSTTQSFAYTGAIASFTLPSNVTGTVQISILGANGGTGGGGDSAAGGFGGAATGTLSLASSSGGTVYWYCVGGQGLSTGTFAGGFCGGGASGSSTAPTHAGPGGGMSWWGTTSTFQQANVAIVAGGGGGAGSTEVGGNAGGATGSAGTQGGSCTQAGQGGTQSAGGAAGGACTGGVSGGAGTAGVGGQGFSNPTNGNPGGGGGGGYYGGGGGGSANAANNGSGAGGGSSFFAANLTGTSTAALGTNGNGSILLSYSIINSTLFSTSTSALYTGGHITTGLQNDATTTVSSCGTNVALSGNDTAGIVNIGSGVVLSCTINFGSGYANPPSCTANSNSTTIYPDISSENTSSVTFGFASSLGLGKIYYHCFDY